MLLKTTPQVGEGRERGAYGSMGGYQREGPGLPLLLLPDLFAVCGHTPAIHTAMHCLFCVMMPADLPLRRDMYVCLEGN